MTHRFDIAHRHKTFTVVVTEEEALELWLDGCLRKRREPSVRDPLYVWTNVELDWEEHHYIEVRYFRGSGLLKATVNGEPILQRSLPGRSASSAAPVRGE